MQKFQVISPGEISVSSCKSCCVWMINITGLAEYVRILPLASTMDSQNSAIDGSGDNDGM
jgi:hypothetical protein